MFQGELEQVIGDVTITPAIVGIVIEDVKVLHDLGLIASAYAFLMGVICARNVHYPQELKALHSALEDLPFAGCLLTLS